MARFNSLLGRNKFPVPMRRELRRKLLNLVLDSEPIVGIWAFSETSSQLTPPSSGESGANLRRAIYHLGERRGAELGTDNAFDRPGVASVSRSRLASANTESIMGPDDLASL
jgi:hypothetical protein